MKWRNEFIAIAQVTTTKPAHEIAYEQLHSPTMTKRRAFFFFHFVDCISYTISLHDISMGFYAFFLLFFFHKIFILHER